MLVHEVLTGRTYEERTERMSRLASSMTVIPVSALVLLSVTGAAQSRPNFSGSWVLVQALRSGPSRGESQPAPAVVSAKIDTISGAAFNCGRQCTITHKGQTLTVDSAQLREVPGQDKSFRAPVVTLDLDGRQATVIDSSDPIPPYRTIPVIAKWQGTSLQVESDLRSDPLFTTQSLSLEGTQLVVVSVRFLNGQRHSEVTLRYAKNAKKT